MSVFGTQNLNKVSNYDVKFITEPKNHWQFFCADVLQRFSMPNFDFEHDAPFQTYTQLAFEL
jgi:hypothetical protein